ncbi:MAG TPA: hypothetical protein PLJ38_03805, partial [bacterium]|nr:hypothetical protein [bacterium]
GGEDITDNHGTSFHTKPNIFGGEDYTNDSNNNVMHSKSNIFGGHDLYHNAQQIGMTQPNIFGGSNIDLLQNFNPWNIPDFSL